MGWRTCAERGVHVKPHAAAQDIFTLPPFCLLGTVLQQDSLIAGRPIFRHTWRHYWHVMGREHWDEDNVKYLDSRPKIEMQPVQLSDDAAWVIGKHEDALAALDIEVPLARGEWPDDLGGRYYPAQRGNNSAMWWEVRRQPHDWLASRVCTCTSD